MRGAADACAVAGFVSRPGAGRPGADYQQIFVNGRPVRDHVLAQGIRAACRDRFLQEKTGVSYFLWLTLPAERVDVNVHPTKREVRFRDHAAVIAIVGEAMRAALRTDSAAHLPAIVPRAGNAHSAPDPRWLEGSASLAADSSTPASYALTSAEQPRLPLVPGPGAAPLTAAEPGASQLFGTYLLCPGPEGIVLVDQHAAHERILYERYLARTASSPSQRLLDPVLFEIAPVEDAALEALRPALSAVGVDIEPIGPRSWRVLALPVELAAGGAVGFVREMVALALAGEVPARVEEFNHRAAALLACHTAVRANQRLGPSEIAALLYDLSRTESPGACPHGRPTSITIDRDEIERRFKRT